MTDRHRLDGKVAIVTGAAGGIGSVVARVLVEAGARVVLADLPGTMLGDAAAAAGDGEHAAAHEVDISDEASVVALIEFTVETFGRLDIVHNNAARQGLPTDLDITSMDVETWDSVFAVNARGDMLMCKHAVPAMAADGGGSIINMSSGTAVAADAMFTAYACSKGAINTLTLYVATQCAHLGVRCNTISPGLIRTPALQAGLPEPVQQLFTEHMLAGRIGEPQDIADLVRFLGSDASSYITAQNIPIDGGFLAHVPTLVDVRRLMAGGPPPG